MPDESWVDLSFHVLWKWSTSDIFDIRIVNLDEGSYLRQRYTKDLETAEKDNKNKYLQACLDSRRSFTPMLYLEDGISGTEVVAAQECLSPLLHNKLKQEYLEVCGFVWGRM